MSRLLRPRTLSSSGVCVDRAGSTMGTRGCWWWCVCVWKGVKMRTRVGLAGAWQVALRARYRDELGAVDMLVRSFLGELDWRVLEARIGPN